MKYLTTLDGRHFAPHTSTGSVEPESSRFTHWLDQSVRGFCTAYAIVVQGARPDRTHRDVDHGVGWVRGSLGKRRKDSVSANHSYEDTHSLDGLKYLASSCFQPVLSA